MDYQRNLMVFGYVTPDRSIVVTPGTIKDEMDRVLREGTTLDADVKGSSVDQSFKNAWQLFWEGYKKFYAENAQGIGGWASRLWISMYNQTVSYGNQLNDWRAKLQSLGGRATEPKMTAAQVREDPNAIPWKPIVTAVSVLGGLALAAYAASKVTTIASIFQKRR